MNPIIQKRYDKAGPRVAAALSRRNMEAFYCPTAIEGVQKVLELIAPEDVVSWGGAMTADEMNLKELLRRRGQPVIDRDTAAEAVEALYAETDDGEDPELATARALVERQYAAKLAAGKRDQVAAALARRGFSHSIIRAALAED